MAVLKRRFTVHPVEIDGEPFHQVVSDDRSLRYALRALDPVVIVRGTELRWEAVIEVEGRRFYGYGNDRLVAFVNARDAALAEGALTAPWDSYAPR